MYKIDEPFEGWIIKEVVGKGGYGKVFRAEKDNYSCAIKQILVPEKEVYNQEKLDKSDEEILGIYRSKADDMVKEVQIMQSLSGISGIVNYQDHKIVKSDQPGRWEILIRMEYLYPIKDLISKNGITISQILDIGIHVSSALEQCHKNKIIHRDIKESNIMMDRYGNYKITDFGVAKYIGSLSYAKTVIGTVGYIAPEVSTGNYDFRVDIYSLGVVLFKLLNNDVMPFIISKSYSEAKRIKTPKNGNDIVNAIILKATSTKRENRYSSFKEMKQDLINAKSNCSEDYLNSIAIFGVNQTSNNQSEIKPMIEQNIIEIESKNNKNDKQSKDTLLTTVLVILLIILSILILTIIKMKFL